MWELGNRCCVSWVEGAKQASDMLIVGELNSVRSRNFRMRDRTSPDCYSFCWVVWLAGPPGGETVVPEIEQSPVIAVAVNSAGRNGWCLRPSPFSVA